MPRRSPFGVNLTLKESDDGFHTLSKAPAPVGLKSLQAEERQLKKAASSPTGGDGEVTTAPNSSQQQLARASKMKSKAMSIAVKPGQQVAMNAFMMWMSGKQLNIFSISTTSMAILTPVTGILSVQKTFRSMSEHTDVQIPKLIFIAINLAWLAIGLYKMTSMRLLPTTSADFSGLVVWKDMMEVTSIPPS